MELVHGYIYIRYHESYGDCCKMGKAMSIPERDTQYATGELKRGYFEIVFEIPINKMGILERMLQIHFHELNVKYNAGTEFYDRKIIERIEPHLISLGIKYRKLTNEEISNLLRPNRVKEAFKKINIKSLIQSLKCRNLIQPKEHQQDVLDKIIEFYRVNDIGKINWACGLGKALLSILIVNLLKFKTIIFGVPSNNLQKQILEEIVKVFPNKNNIIFVGGCEKDGIKTINSTKEIISFLEIERKEPKFIITTYHSCHLLVDNNIKVDFKIGDEAHHLVGIIKEEEKGFRLFHKITSTKSLFMTATEKIIETDKQSYSMDDEEIFGKYIDVKTVQWAIENRKITDYNILVIKNNEEQVDKIINSLGINARNKELFMSCYMCLKSFEKYNDLTHLLLYTNTTEDAEIAKDYICQILDLNVLSINKEDIYNNVLHSKNCKNLESEISKFKTARYGIISCVYMFGEGTDLPKLNGVCIAANMQSETRIVQYLLRPNRLEVGNPDKKAYIIIPYLDNDDWQTEDKSYENIRNIVYKMRNVDENIEQKISVLIAQNKEKKTEMKETTELIEDYDFEENIDELNKIKLRLRYSKTLGSKFSEEQDEYNYVRSINESLNIKSKQEYNLSTQKHKHFILNPEEYFKLKGVWTDWYDFMGYDTKNFIQSKQEWMKFCQEINVTSLVDYYEKCEIQEQLPKEPADFYKDFTNISFELGFNRIRR